MARTIKISNIALSFVDTDDTITFVHGKTGIRHMGMILEMGHKDCVVACQDGKHRVFRFGNMENCEFVCKEQ